ncbi:MAG TPA: FtsX-like permease family protein [Mycobacteriales bacterium]|nr:FtsX-like permease family protein [Mycobacteriales bacterium]
MFDLALRSVRMRSSAFLASFIGMFLGAVILMSFGSLLDTRAAGGMSADDKETLAIMAMVVGGIGAVIVVFTVASTLMLAVRQRASEMALLKSVGATPAQLGRMIVGEAAIVAVGAAALAIPVSVLSGWGLLKMLASTGRVSGGITYHFGESALVVGVGITVLASTIAAAFTARRTARMRVTESLLDAAIDNPRPSRKRIVAGAVFLIGGLNCAVLTATIFNGGSLGTTQSVAGEASVLSSIGFALLAPTLIRRVTYGFAVALQRFTGVGGYLTVQNVRQRSQQMSGALMPIIVLTGLAIGVLYVQSIENSLVAAKGVATADDKGTETLNYVVVGMICAFAAIALINSLIAATTYRRREFGQQRLVGSTPAQVLGMVGVEGVALILTGILFGSIAGLLTVIPYNIARTDSIIPNSTAGIYVGILASVVVLTLASSIGAARRTIRTPAVEAVAA